MQMTDVLSRTWKAVTAAITWPKFSVTSFLMLSNLVRQGVLPKTVIDVGANVGQFAVASAKLFSGVTVHSFEPNPACVDTLRGNVKSLSNIAVYPLALGEKPGEVDFNVNSHSHSSSVLSLSEHHKEAFPEAREVGSVKVKMTTLDEVLGSSALPAPVLLKLDVQGYEAQVLKGAPQLLRRVDFVIIEVSFKPMYRGETLFIDLVQLVETFGFRFLRPVGWLTDPHTGEILQMDALFARA
jgi:FkbM family methyltransferase